MKFKTQREYVGSSMVIKTMCECVCVCCVWQRLEKEAEESYLDSPWADGQQLKRQFQGMKDVKWGPRWPLPLFRVPTPPTHHHFHALFAAFSSDRFILYCLCIQQTLSSVWASNTAGYGVFRHRQTTGVCCLWASFSFFIVDWAIEWKKKALHQMLQKSLVYKLALWPLYPSSLLSAFLILNPDVHSLAGEKKACASVFHYTYTLVSHIQVH